MTTVYAVIPFQEDPKIICGDNNTSLDELQNKSIPSDLPDNWDKVNIFPIFYGFQTKNQLTMAMTERGADDQFGRPNLLTHAVIGNNPLFLADPLSSLYPLRTHSIKNIEDVHKAVLSFCISEIEYQKWMQSLPFQGNIKKLAQVLGSILSRKVSYIQYSKIEDYIQIIRILYFIVGQSERSNITFESYTSTGIGGNSSARIRGIRSNDITHHEQGNKTKILKREKAFFVNLDSLEMENQSEIQDKQLTILNELLSSPWFGLSRFDHFSSIRSIIELHDKDPKIFKELSDLIKAGGTLVQLIESYTRIGSFLQTLKN